MTDDLIERLEEEYWTDVDEDWRSLVCTDDRLTEHEYQEYLDAWWAYADEEEYDA